jgi:hypothetical protein
MKIIGLPLALSALVLFSPALPAEDDVFPGFEALMTEQEYQAAGLSKLTAAERDALNRWLIRYTAEDSQVIYQENEEVIQAVEEQEILSAILPPFNGWWGDTIFKLENGQVWQQRQGGNYPYHGDPKPQVKITKNFMGFFRMELVAKGKVVQVKRLK